LPAIIPEPNTNRIVLTSTGSAAEVTAASLPFGVFVSSSLPLAERNEWISGAVSQVAYTYRMLGGAVLDIELTTHDIYSSYEIACLEYSYIVNLHQAKSALPSLLGAMTSSFDHRGEYSSGELSSSLSGGNVSLKFPKIQFTYENRWGKAVGSAYGLGGDRPLYSASINLSTNKQDYDIQTILQAQSADSNQLFYNKVNNKQVRIHRVYYKSARAVWRFYGYYGGLASVGNLSTYGQFADDHTFQMVPVWQNKAQAAAYEDALQTRISHYSYEIHDNRLRLFPPPDETLPKAWIEFSVDTEPWEESGFKQDVDAVNNMNTLPFANIAYKNINSIGKHWIRRFALAVAKGILAQNRGKFQTIPIPGDSVTLNFGELGNQSKEEIKELRDELKTILDELTYSKLAEDRANQSENINKTLGKIPMFVYMG